MVATMKFCDNLPRLLLLFGLLLCMVDCGITREKPATNHRTISSNRTSQAQKPSNVTSENELTSDSITGVSRDELILELQNSGLKVINSSTSDVLVLVGDTLHYAEEFLADQGDERFARMNVIGRNLWKNAEGKSEFRYFFDLNSETDHQMFIDAIESWTETTCIRVKQLEAGTKQTVLTEGAAIVGNYGGCHSMLGDVFHPRRPYAQELSVNPAGCEKWAAAHEVGHGLGLMHMMSRPDRNDYIYFNPQNVEYTFHNQKYRSDQTGHWFQGQRESREGITYTPAPYDYSSLMQYGAADFADKDKRIVYTVKDSTKLYIFNYQRKSGIMQTHYDLYVLNSAYGCLDEWKELCDKNGASGVKCENYGYMGKDCVCHCPIGTSGSRCETLEELYPMQPRGKCLVIVEEEKTIDLAECGMTLENPHPLETFKGFQFFTVIGKSSGAQNRVTMLINLPLEKIERVARLANINNALIADTNLISLECTHVMRIFVGDSPRNKIRTLCYSQLYQMDLHPVEYHSRDDELDFNGYLRVGNLFDLPELALAMASFTVNVSYHDNGKYMMPPDSKMVDVDSGLIGSGSTGVYIALLVIVIVAAGGGYMYYRPRTTIRSHTDQRNKDFWLKKLRLKK